jgi:subtilisin
LDSFLSNQTEVERVERDYVQNWLKGVRALQGCPDWWPPDLPCPFPPDEGGGGGGGGAQKTPWGIERVGAPKAWAKTRGDGIKVAVIDTGVDSKHPELKVLGGYSAVEGDTSWEDGHGHGTHVSGTIAALDNTVGVVGVAPNVELYGVKVLNAKGEGTYATVIGGVQWAVENKMVIANMSLGGDETTEAFKDAMQAAADKGLTVVAAAGNNSGAVGYPAKYPSTIAVAASDSSDKGAYFSSRGPEVDVIAPGARIYSTFKGGGYSTLDGTSMASPHVAGLAALAAAATGARGIDAIRAALKSAATKLPGVSNDLNGAGMVSAEKLVSGSGLLTLTR